MNVFQALVLGIAQGLTEFIPVSSSGHLVILHQAMGISPNGLTFDVALHIGTLIALIAFFYKDLLLLTRSLFVKTRQTHLAWLLAAATIPAVIAGVLLESAAESRFRSSALVSINLIVVAFIMLGAEYYAKRRPKKTKLDNVKKSQALSMGLAQAAAIVPGVSRSGATITAGIFTGMDRVSATRFSFLLGVPITLGAVAKVLIKDSAFTQINSDLHLFIIGIITAFITGLFAIKFMLNYLSKHSLAVFAYYRIILAAFVLLILSLN